MTILSKISLLASGPAVVQADKSDGANVIREILVTASRREESLLDVDVAIKRDHTKIGK